MNSFENLLINALFVVGDFSGPAAMIWGWISFARRKDKRWTTTFAFSFVGFALACASVVLELALILYALSGAYENADYREHCYWFIFCGGALSVLALLFAIMGIWKKHCLRWPAPAGALGTLVLWVMTAAWT